MKNENEERAKWTLQEIPADVMYAAPKSKQSKRCDHVRVRPSDLVMLTRMPHISNKLTLALADEYNIDTRNSEIILVESPKVFMYRGVQVLHLPFNKIHAKRLVLMMFDGRTVSVPGIYQNPVEQSLTGQQREQFDVKHTFWKNEWVSCYTLRVL